ncbi:hypothetical protein EON65_11230 [archaeon]|nr:MAG: hypothetical protein EON65_11230 [archaeon]
MLHTYTDVFTNTALFIHKHIHKCIHIPHTHLGIDRLERLKGIPLRLMALDQFLEENPQYVGKLVFTLIGISAGERGQDYRQTQHDVKILIGR